METLTAIWQWIREYNVDIIGVIGTIIFAVGLFPPIFKKKKKEAKTIPDIYTKAYKAGEKHVITTATDNFEKDEMTIMVGPRGIIEFNPPTEDSEFETIFEPWPSDKEKLKRKLDL